MEALISEPATIEQMETFEVEESMPAQSTK